MLLHPDRNGFRAFQKDKKRKKLLVNLQTTHYQRDTKLPNPCDLTSQELVGRFRGHSRKVTSDFLTTVKVTNRKQLKGERVKS